MLDYTILDNGKAEFRVKKSLYPLKAIYRAAYLFMDDDYIGLDMDEEHFIIRFMHMYINGDLHSRSGGYKT